MNTEQNKTPRGIRNNNPLNIRRTSKTTWQGQRNEITDSAFVEFKTMAWGWRAAFILLCRTYFYQHHRYTIRKIITAWAPPADKNNTNAYIDTVCGMMDRAPDESLPIPGLRPAEWMKLAWSMAYVENGRKDLDAFELFEGWTMYQTYAGEGRFVAT